MQLYIYQGLANEKVPFNVTHAIVDSRVTIIKSGAFSDCNHLVSVIMGDNVSPRELEWRLSVVVIRLLLCSSIYSTLQDVGIHWGVGF